MKLAGKKWWYLVIVAVAAAAVWLSMTQSSLKTYHEELKNELDQTAAGLQAIDMETLRNDLAEVETAIEEKTGELEDVQDKYRRLTESLAAVKELFKIAGESGVILPGDGISPQDFQSSGTTDSSLKSIDMIALPVSIKASGEMDDLLDFISRITDRYPFGELLSVDIRIPEVPDLTAEEISEGTEEEEDTDVCSVTIKLIIYTYLVPEQ